MKKKIQQQTESEWQLVARTIWLNFYTPMLLWYHITHCPKCAKESVHILKHFLEWGNEYFEVKNAKN